MFQRLLGLDLALDSTRTIIQKKNPITLWIFKANVKKQDGTKLRCQLIYGQRITW